MKLTKLLILLVALPASLSVSTAALADNWDTLGSKANHNRGASATRYSLPKQNYRHNNNRHNQHTRSRQNSSVNIIVGNVPPIGRWSSPYNPPRNRSRASSNNTVMVFNSSLGYISSEIANQAYGQNSHQHNNNHNSYYSDDYYETSRVIRTEEIRSGVSYLKDRNGQCFEKEVDRYGRIIKSRVADYNCRF